jgi:hypothetical protein
MMPILIYFALLFYAEQGLAYSELEGSSADHSTFRQKAKVLLFVHDIESFAFFV